MRVLLTALCLLAYGVVWGQEDYIVPAACENGNTGFDQGPDGLDDYTVIGNPASVSVTGGRLRIAPVTGFTAVQSASLTVDPSRRYTLAFRAETPNTTGAGASVRITSFDAGSASLGDQTYPEVHFDDSRLEFEYTPPAGAASARIQVSNNSGADEAFFDDLCLRDRGPVGANSRISGLSFNDINGNGFRDAGGPGVNDDRLAETSVHLYRDNGDGVRDPAYDQVVARTRTTGDPEGYVFRRLPAGDYFVVAYLSPVLDLSPTAVGHPADRDSDFEPVNLGNWRGGVTPILTVNGDDDVRDVDFGQVPTGTAGASGIIWNDANADNLHDEDGSFGLNGVIVRAELLDGTPLGNTVTRTSPDGVQGFYELGGFPPQTIRLQIDLPPDLTGQPLLLDNQFNSSDAYRTNSIGMAPNYVQRGVKGALRTTGTENCFNGVDDDGDGRIDYSDGNCLNCVVTSAETCGDPLTYYMPPIWQLTDSGNNPFAFEHPSYLNINTDVAQATVTVRTQDGSFVATSTVNRGATTVISLPKDVVQTRTTNATQSNKGLIVESDFPIQANYYLDAFFTQALVTLKGQQALGTSFRAGSQVQQYTSRGANSSADPLSGPLPAPNTGRQEAHFISVMATEDNTQVTFSYDAARLQLFGGLTSPHVVTLNEGESYLVRDDDTNQTVSGVSVESDKLIVVNSGSQHTQLDSGGGEDSGIDQLVPICYTGVEYVVTKHAGTGVQHYAVVVSNFDGTEVFVDGNSAPYGTVDAGGWLKVPVSGNVGEPKLITTTYPSYVYQISGISTSNSEVGMALAASIGDCRGNLSVAFAKQPSKEYSLSVVTTTASRRDLLVNGAVAEDLPSAIATPVRGKPDYISIVIDQADLADDNFVESSSYFQAALLVAVSGRTGTFGYLTNFAESILVIDPSTNRESNRYSIDPVCAGTTINHTILASGCGSGVNIGGFTNDASKGTVTKTGPLTFDYQAAPGATGSETISLELSDDNGTDKIVCVEFFICGPPSTVTGVPASQTLACGATMPAGNPVADTEAECPLSVGWSYSDATTAGSCANRYQVERTWTATTNCGFVISRSATFTFDDTTPPTFAGVPGPTAICAGDAEPTGAPTASDNCGGSTTLTYAPSYASEAGTSRRVLSRTWTAEDECGNAAVAVQSVTVYESSSASVSVSTQDPTCGNSNGGITLTWTPDKYHASREIQVGGGAFVSYVETAGTATVSGLAPGTYTIDLRWPDGPSACPASLPAETLTDRSATLAAVQLYDLGAGTGTTIADGASYRANTLPTDWNLRSGATGSTPSVRYTISGTVADTRLDAVAPYAYATDAAALAWTAGTYTVATSAYPNSTGTGPSCADKSVTFTIVPVEICGDGIDNDGDGLIDECDPACPPAQPAARILPGS